MSRYSRTISTLAVVAGLALVGGAPPTAQAAPAEFKYKTYKVPTARSELGSMTLGSDGNLWFTEGRDIFTPNADPNTGGTFSSNIGRITPSGAITEFRVDGANGGSVIPHDIVQGPGGVLYFTSNSGLGRIGTNGTVMPFVPDAPFSVGGMELARGGNNIWITDFNGDNLWRYDTGSGVFTQFPLAPLFDPADVAVDGLGNVWFGATQQRNDGALVDVIGRLDPPAGTITTTDVVGEVNAVSIATDRKVWFTDRFNDTVGYVDPLNANNLQQFDTAPDSGPQQITAAADGSMWFTQGRIGNAARVTAGGTITVAGRAVGDDPTSGLEAAQGIAVLPGTGGESVWFTMPEANKVASLK
jgi:streptogramin lyase